MSLPRIAVALDVPDLERALALVDRLGDDADFYKVGLELFTRTGPQAVRKLRERGKRVFLDLKLHDIPNTVAGAVRSAAAEGVDLLTVHATGGRAMLQAAAEATAGEGPRLVAVTVLTSASVTEVESAWGRTIDSVREEVVRLAGLAREAGIDGAVASAAEAQALRRSLGPDFLLVTPGIRLPGGDTHDQSRVATPASAVRAGADVLVVGRTVTAADDPAAAFERVRRHLEQAAA